MQIKMRQSFIAGVLTILSLSSFVVTPVSAETANMQPHANQVSARLHSVNSSKVEGFVDLSQLRNTTGTQISLVAFGLMAGQTYVSLYYGNHVCNLEPYSASDVIGGIYTANRVGVGVTHGNATDNLDEINSVSVRDVNTFTLLACADIHPNK